MEILTRDDFTCVYCGARGRDEALHVDHVLPRNEGGSDRRDNLVTACRRCNLGKGRRRIFPDGQNLSWLSGRCKPFMLRRWSVADLARRPWLRQISLIGIMLEARMGPPWGSRTDADDAEFDQQFGAIAEQMIATIDECGERVLPIDWIIASFAEYAGECADLAELAVRVRYYHSHFAAALG